MNQHPIVRFEVFRVVKVQVEFFWVLTPCRDEPGGGKFLRNVGILLPHYTASCPGDGGSGSLRNVGILLHPYTASCPENGGSGFLRNVGILPQYGVTI
jgi:hypothetical protein